MSGTESIAVAMSLFSCLVSLATAFFVIPKTVTLLIERKAKELSTHTVVPGQLIDALAKDPNFQVSAADLEDVQASDAMRQRRKGNAKYGTFEGPFG